MFRNLSIRYKLLAIIGITSLLSLSVAATALILYDVSTYKDGMVRNLSVQADIIAVNTTGALTFQDYDAASSTLSALQKENTITIACLAGTDGKPLAKYQRWDEKGGPSTPLLTTNGYRFSEDRLAVRRPIRFDGEELGSVYIETDLSALHERVIRFIAALLGIVMLALTIVFAASSKLQGFVSGPILSLAALANKISRDKNYRLRAERHGDDEVGVLIDGFNAMLGEIETRDAMLEQNKQALELEVAKQTSELRQLNTELRESQKRLTAIVQGTASSTGEEFFDALVASLAEAMGTRWVMVSTTQPRGTATALALWTGSEVERGLEYSLEGTPCHTSQASGYCRIDDDVQNLFPKDDLLREFGVHSYVGCGLRNGMGKDIGTLCAFHDGPLPDTAKSQDMMSVFASRAAAELERIQADTALQESEASTRAILESAADGIITVDKHGTVETANAAFEEMFQAPTDQLVGREVRELMRPVDAADGTDECEQARGDSLISRFVGERGEIEGIRPDGGVFPMSIAARAIQSGSHGGYTAIVRDVTREHELDKMKTDFISTASHEIRTPLACILSSANILSKHGATKPEVTGKFSKIILDESQRLSRLVNDMLDLSKMDANKTDWKLEYENPATIVTSIADMFAPQAADRGLTVTSKFAEEELPDIHVDRDKLMQVLINLTNNAMKFTDPGGSIEISAELDDKGAVCFSVSDDGIGIAEKDIDRVFERFQQIGDVQTNRPQGTGLGLPICKEIVRFFGGRIWIESEEGVGSSFRFTIPASTGHELSEHEQAASDEQPAAPATSSHPGAQDDRSSEPEATARNPVVLVVDDDESTREIIAFHLQNNGIEVIRASGGEEALQLARERRPDLITLDVMMPDMSGYHVIRELRADDALRDTPVVLLSVLTGQNQNDHALRVGANAYLSKPVSASNLVETVTKLLEEQHHEVLVITDDQDESATIKTNLTAEGYKVTQAFDANSGLELARRIQPELVILGSAGSKSASQHLIEQLRNDEKTASISVVLLTGVELDESGWMSLGSVANPRVTGALSELIAKIENAGSKSVPVVLPANDTTSTPD